VGRGEEGMAKQRGSRGKGTVGIDEEETNDLQCGNGPARFGLQGGEKETARSPLELETRFIPGASCMA
jgi:hypothetical protein